MAAGYCMYGSSCSMVISVGSAPAHFTLDPSLGEFVLTQPALTIPSSGTIYSINEGNASLWDGPTTRCVHPWPFTPQPSCSAHPWCHLCSFQPGAAVAHHPVQAHSRSTPAVCRVPLASA